MELKVDHQKKNAYLWLTNADQQDPAVVKQMEELCEAYHQKGYLPCVFRSGKEDLYQYTKDLLLYNRRKQAQKIVSMER